MSLRRLEEYLNREFGELPAADLGNRAKRRAADLAARVPQIRADEVLNQSNSPGALPEFSMPEAERAEGRFDRTRMFGAGFTDLAEMGVGALEYVARQNRFLRPGVAPALKSVRGGISDARETILSGVSPDYLEQVGREVMTLDPDKTIWQGSPLDVADSIYGKFVRSLPSTLAVMLPAARWFRAANTRGALTYLGASEGGLSVGAIQNNLVDEIAEMTNEELLAESRRYAEIYDRMGNNEELARQAFTTQAQGAAPLVGGLGVASISLATGRLLKPVFSDGGLSFSRRVARGFLAEAPQEGSQGATEQFVQNFAARLYDEQRPLSEGALEAAGQEGLIGGLTGGAVGGAFGRRPKPPLPPPEAGPDGQFGLPGIGPAVPSDEPPAPPPAGYGPYGDPAEVAVRNEQLGLVGGLDTDPRSGRDLSRSTEGVLVPPSADSPTGVPEQRLLPMTLRERGRPVLQESPRGPRTGAIIPDALDRPTAEPQEDLQAQINDMKSTSDRLAVYIPPTQTRTERLTFPKGAVVIPNFDGKGGQLIAKNGKAAAQARKRRAEGGSMQTIIGELTLAGVGKPAVRSGYVVQRLDKSGAVARESFVATKKEANELRKKWKTSGLVQILSGDQALARRNDRIRREREDLPQDNTAVRQRNEQLDLGPNTPTVMPPFKSEQEKAIENVRKELPDIEERAEAISFLKGVTSRKQAAGRLAKMARARSAQERRRSLGGYVAPSELTFDDAEQQAEYEAAFNDALDAELTIELSRQKRAVERAKARRSKAFRRLAIARKIGKPKVRQQKSERLARAAARSDAPTTRARLENLPISSRPVGEIEDFGELDPAMAKDRIRKATGQDLNVFFEQALNTYVARQATLNFPELREEGKPVTPDEVASDSNLLERQYRAQYNTPGKKRKFVLRELAAQKRRVAEIRDVKDTKIRTKPAKQVGTASLTTERTRTEESVAEERTRIQKVKEADARLRGALRSAKQFIKRFETSGEYGAYIENQKQLDNSLTQEGRDFLLARKTFVDLIYLGDSVLASKTQSAGHVKLADSVSNALERARQKSMTPVKFAKVFSDIHDAMDADMLKTVPARFRESVTERDRKINKLNAERKRARDRQRLLEQQWQKDEVWSAIVGPIFRKFSEATMVGEYYNPSRFEIENLRYALRTFSKLTARYSRDKFYKPVRDQLEYYGFEFDEKGDLIVQDFSPSENLLGSKFLRKFGVSKKEAGVTGREGIEIHQSNVEFTPSAAIRARQEVTENRKSVRDIRIANALLARFKQMSAPSKVTINGIKRQEQRFIRGLRKIGAWVDVSPGMGRIRIGGFRSKTYRLVGPRLDNRTLLKADAKNFIQRIAEFSMPRELLPIANRMTGLGVTVDEFVEQNTAELFLENTKPDQYDADYLNAASAIGDSLEGRGEISALDALTDILKEAPVDSFYYQLADKLSTLNLPGVSIAYGDVSDFPGGSLGKFRPKKNLVLLNRDALSELNQHGDRVFGARVMHVITHEIMHAATHVAIRDSTALRRYFEALQWHTREYVSANGIPRTMYGLKRGAPIDEFVVEAFSNYEFQNLLKQVPVGLDTAWKKIIQFLREFLGLATINDTVFEAVMLTEDILFEEAGATGPRESGDFFIMDSVLNNIGSTVRHRAVQSSGIFQRVKKRLEEQARSGFQFNRAAFNIMTMEQFREAYDKPFNGLLGKYVEAFQRRNASTAQYMQLPEKLARRWTSLQESSPEAALKLSQVMTDATLNNEIATEGKGEIQSRYNALPDEAKSIYKDVRQYYRDAVEKEQSFLMQSALRGITGLDFSEERLNSVKSKDDMKSLLEKHIDEQEIDDVVDTLYRMSQVSQMKKGDYFPLMRYGEEVVYAEKQRESEFFESRKEAWARRQEIIDSDPTLDVHMKKAEDDQWEVRTFEREFVMAETRSEIETEWERLKQEYGAQNVADPQKRRSRTIDSAITSNAQLNSILSTLKDNPAAQAAIKNFYLRSLSESSMRKHETQRKNRRGVRRDLQHRNLATYAKQASYYTAQLEHGWKMADAIQEMEQFLRRRRAEPGEATTRNLSLVLEHLKKRDEMGLDLPDVDDLVRKGVEGTHFFMLTSPSYWAINATQPWMVSLPTMAAKFGWGQSMSAMKDIQRLIAPRLLKQAKKTKGGISTFKNRVLTEESFNILDQVKDHIRENAPERYEEYNTLLDELRDRHVIDINVFTEMRELAAGKVTSMWTNVVDASRIMAHLTEVNNRVLTALSAYQLAVNDGMSIDDARLYAGDMVSQTQFNYSSQNKPPLFQAGGPIGGFAPLMFQFMQWPQHMYAHLIRNFAKLTAEDVVTRREAQRTVIGLLSTHAAVGGLAGMMLQPIKWAFGAAMMALGDENEPYTLANTLSGATFDQFISDTTADIFGTHISTIVSKGLPAGVAGIDLSARMSLGTFYYVDLRGDSAESVLGSLVASFGGATLNQAIKLGTGVGQVMDGDFLRGIETASPKMARDVLRAARYYNEGLVNNAGDTVIDASEMSFYEVLVQFFGFSPTDISNFYSSQRAIKGAERYVVGRRGELMRRFRDAETSSERRKVRRDIHKFNMNNPAERITASALIKNIQAQRVREARFRRFGANINERKARFYEDYGDNF